MLIVDSEYVRDMNMLGGILVAIKTKESVGSGDATQAALELISASTYSNYPVIVLLTDLNKVW